MGARARHVGGPLPLCELLAAEQPAAHFRHARRCDERRSAGGAPARVAVDVPCGHHLRIRRLLGVWHGARGAPRGGTERGRRRAAAGGRGYRGVRRHRGRRHRATGVAVKEQDPRPCALSILHSHTRLPVNLSFRFERSAYNRPTNPVFDVGALVGHSRLKLRQMHLGTGPQARHAQAMRREQLAKRAKQRQAPAEFSQHDASSELVAIYNQLSPPRRSPPQGDRVGSLAPRMAAGLVLNS